MRHRSHQSDSAFHYEKTPVGLTREEQAAIRFFFSCQAELLIQLFSGATPTPALLSQLWVMLKPHRPISD